MAELPLAVEADEWPWMLWARPHLDVNRRGLAGTEVRSQREIGSARRFIAGNPSG